ncbi:MAG: SIR2 family protein, partial [Anaerolineae bacterium]
MDLINRLARFIVQDNAVLFVGASLRQGPDEHPLVRRIADALAARIQYERPDRSLPAVARDFQVQHERAGLIVALREELERLGGQPAPIHQLIADAVLPSTKVITTRFDRVLERALDQAHKSYVLIVRDTDVPFFDETKITLIKMQGDITQPDSLVITADDVDAFISKLPTISDVVRAFFATKTLIFLGYDLEGEQFKRLFRQVTRNLATYRRQAYAIVSQPVDEVEARYWESHNVTICHRDPRAFLEALAPAVKAAVVQPEMAAHNPLDGMAQPPLPPHPYKGLDSFTGADAAIFMGRTEESHRLANRILAHRLTVLYGESGSGKTSLLQA